MAFSRESFIQEFVSESKDNLNAINDSIIKLKNNPSDKEFLTSILRNLHTVKGSSRMMAFTTIENISHGLEDVFKGLREEKYTLTDRLVQLTFTTTDIIQSLLNKVAQSQSDSYDTTKLFEAFSKASEGLFFAVEELKVKDNTEKEKESGFEDLNNITSIRISIDKINEIVKAFDDIITKQFRFKQQLEDLHIQNFPSQMKEDLQRIEKSILATQHQILNLRMLPLDLILSPLKKQIELEAMKSGKSVVFDIPQTNFMLDKVILSQLQTILLHLVRNSIDHGLETTEERIKAGKEKKGLISIHAEQRSNHLIITESDNGRGINYEKVRQKSKILYPNQADEIEAASEQELQQYIFRTGFSTLSTPTLLSGRGMGLDIVKNAMEMIKGKIHIKSKSGEGTSFELTLPLTLATQEGLFIHSSDMKFMLPADYIAELIDNDTVQKTIIQDQPYINWHNKLVPVYNLSSVFGNQQHQESFQIIIVEYLETNIGITVDSIDKYENLVTIPLPKIMQNMQPLRGVVFDENYSIIPILNVPDIMQRLKRLVSYDIKKYRTKSIKRNYSVLIVDDSNTTRQIEQAIFESAGFIVDTAIDGNDALNKLKAKHIDAVVTDINMPRMDGITLLSNIRLMKQYNNTPVIVVSGAYDPEAKKQFLDAGAQAFIVKSEFQRGNLLQAVKEFLND